MTRPTVLLPVALAGLLTIGSASAQTAATPARITPEQIDAHLRFLKEMPVERIGLFRRALLVSRFPWPVRRLIWWIGLNASGPKRARRMGTFGVSVYSGLGAESLHPLSPLTTTLNYGVIGSDGTVAVRIVYDHRVMDGSTVARALAYMEEVLNTDVIAEFEELPERDGPLLEPFHAESAR